LFVTSLQIARSVSNTPPPVERRRLEPRHPDRVQVLVQHRRRQRVRRSILLYCITSG
jgi:hypothetical protein